MFTGFASENTPAIQVWNFFRECAQGPTISLSDDCAPIQLIKTGGSGTAIALYLPSSPIEGAQIKICNLMYGSNNQRIQVRASDVSGTGSSTIIFSLGPACNLDLIYSKDFISNGVTGGTPVQTGWVALNLSPRSAYNYGSIVVGSDNSAAYENGAAIFGGSGHLVGASNGVVVGGANNNVFGFRGSVVGGTANNGNGQYSGVFGGQSNTASQTNAVIVGGSSNTASSTGAAVIGGSSNTASNTNAAVLGGAINAASGIYSGIFSSSNTQSTALLSVVLGGEYNLANSDYSVCAGGTYGSTRSIRGSVVLPASINPVAAAAGISQSATLILGRQTTDATPTVLRSNTSAASTTNQVILPNNSAYYFRGSVTSGVTGGGNSAMWTFEGGIKRGANAAATTLIQSVINPVAADTGASSWVVALSADTTNGGLAVTVTGQASTTIRWVCKIETTEMTF